MNGKRTILFTILVILVLFLVACTAQTPVATEAPMEAAEEAAEAPGESAGEAASTGYNVALLNPFMGNTWRPIMERSAQLLAQEGPLADKVARLRIMNTENSPVSQNAAVNALILEGETDLILFNAASPTASNQALEAACDAGIVVVTFDVFAETPCAWKVNQVWQDMGYGQAKWMIDQVGEDAVLFHDLGMAGATSSQYIVEGNNEVLDQYPNLTIYTYYGEFAQGTEQASVTTLLAAHPEVDGVIGHSYGSNILYAFDKAGLDPVPITGFSYNESLQACANYGAPCLLKGQAPWVSAEAMKLGLQILEGEVTGEPRFVEMHMPWFTNTDDHSFVRNENDPVFGIEENIMADFSGGLMLPLSPPWHELDPWEVLAPPEFETFRE